MKFYINKILPFMGVLIFFFTNNSVQSSSISTDEKTIKQNTEEEEEIKTQEFASLKETVFNNKKTYLIHTFDLFLGLHYTKYFNENAPGSEELPTGPIKIFNSQKEITLGLDYYNNILKFIDIGGGLSLDTQTIVDTGSLFDKYVLGTVTVKNQYFPVLNLYLALKKDIKINDKYKAYGKLKAGFVTSYTGTLNLNADIPVSLTGVPALALCPSNPCNFIVNVDSPNSLIVKGKYYFSTEIGIIYKKILVGLYYNYVSFGIVGSSTLNISSPNFSLGGLNTTLTLQDGTTGETGTSNIGIKFTYRL